MTPQPQVVVMALNLTGLSLAAMAHLAVAIAAALLLCDIVKWFQAWLLAEIRKPKGPVA